MTNNTQLVSVPRELLERWADRFSKAQMFKDSTEVRAVLAAAAEDVRAVVEEPVAYLYKEYVWATGLCDYVWRTQLESEAPTDDQNVKDIDPLYRHPQRPVVLPERMISTNTLEELKAEGYNQCIADCERLNK
ncbi:hypothetical protein OKW98_18715 [Pseudomonas sp. KU26590]|uniref:hypothetical protein n=1 Tax=Pseudomonas sp. KU26590 TaxID=2991051 RepID=UPI00223CBE5B|nr:hypothetical protein [Pseudomonas sp. KU26590]UZJ58611.1 hypothetical protein OKW98_18715 [Pseudomonas sp. KU26590]